MLLPAPGTLAVAAFADDEATWPWLVPPNCWFIRLAVEVKLPLVLLVDDVMDTLSPQMLLLVPILS